MHGKFKTRILIEEQAVFQYHVAFVVFLRLLEAPKSNRITAQKAQQEGSTALHPVTIPIAEAAQRLRALVQHVLSRWRYSGAIMRLDCLHALGDKTLYVRLTKQKQ